MSFISIFENAVLKKQLSINPQNIFNNLSIKVNYTKKCNIRNTYGIITPKITDDYLSNSLITTNKIKYSKENIEQEQDLTNEKTTNKTSSNKIVLNTNQVTNQIYTKANLNYFPEAQMKSKPNLNIKASKALMKEYSNTKRYKEDKLILFPSEEKAENMKISKKIEPENPKLPEAESETNDLEELLKYQESHLPVPLSKKDNEKFKILKMKQMKRVSMPPNKSVRKFAEDIEPHYEKEFRILNSFSSMKKRKPVHSTRRLYSSNYILYKDKGNSEKFMVFRDKDIGIYEYWQAHIHETHNDEDVETDEEQKKIALNFCISEVREGLEYISNYGNDSFVNFNRYGHLLKKKKAKEIMDNIEDNLENLNLSKDQKKKK